MTYIAFGDITPPSLMVTKGVERPHSELFYALKF
jgi:hypothetical protein